MKRAIVLVMDSFGIGEAPDATDFDDAGADTLGHIADGRRDRPLDLPNLARLGLFHAHHASTARWAPAATIPPLPSGAWGYASERSTGKDTPSGHWELAGLPVDFEWGYFPDASECFPEALLADLVREGALPGVLGNCQASGTEIIAELGEAHIATGRPIVYTSADSVFQIAAHEAHFGLERLYRLCGIARRLLDPYRVGRVIARPFRGETRASFERTGNRRDYAVPPHGPTMLDRVSEAGGAVIAVGKIADIYAHKGVSECVRASGHNALFDATLEALDRAGDGALVMTNFIDFDMVYGHRRDPEGYAAALEHFDRRLPELLDRLGPEDLLIVTADHGCDPTWRGTDHTRENIPVLALGAGTGFIGHRDGFADIGRSVTDHLGVAAPAAGRSFLSR